MMFPRVVALLAAVGARADTTFDVYALTPNFTTAWTFSGAYSTVPAPTGEGCPYMPDDPDLQLYSVALDPGAEATLTVSGTCATGYEVTSHCAGGIQRIQYGLSDPGIMATVSFYAAGSLDEQHYVDTTASNLFKCDWQEYDGWYGSESTVGVTITVPPSAPVAGGAPPFVLITALYV